MLEELHDHNSPSAHVTSKTSAVDAVTCFANCPCVLFRDEDRTPGGDVSGVHHLLVSLHALSSMYRSSVTLCPEPVPTSNRSFSVICSDPACVLVVASYSFRCFLSRYEVMTQPLTLRAPWRWSTAQTARRVAHGRVSS